MAKYILLPLFFFLSISGASACSFSQDADRFQTAESNFDKYETIFLGEVAQVTELGGFEGRSFEFQVLETLKGEQKTTREVTSAAHSCGSFFSVGQIGLFFLSEDVTQIDESNPRYLYSSFVEANQAIAELIVREVSENTQQVEPVIPEGTLIGPKTSPLDGFVEPSGPPPFDNSPQEEAVVQKKTNFFEKIRVFISGLFSWLF